MLCLLRALKLSGMGRNTLARLFVEQQLSVTHNTDFLYGTSVGCFSSTATVPADNRQDENQMKNRASQDKILILRPSIVRYWLRI